VGLWGWESLKYLSRDASSNTSWVYRALASDNRRSIGVKAVVRL